ncbi:MAG: antitoxin Xre/MbcA/ParS toxin-binding domain-containing protein [Isosphaerales bacterium]
MSKTDVATPRRDSGRSKQAARDHGAGRPAGHSYVSLLGIQAFDTAGLLERVRAGLAYSSWDRFLQSTGLAKDAACDFVQITPRTLARRKEEGRLHPDESDRLVRAARIFSQAVGLFEGDEQAARRWLTVPQPALGGSTPWDYAATEIGAREVESLIGRLEHGIPS